MSGRCNTGDVGIVVTVEVEGQPLTVPDPSGGSCTAAGDFDALLPLGATYPMLSRIDPYDEVVFTVAEMVAVADEADRAVALASHDQERRGLLRLGALARHGSRISGALLRVQGD
jgi:hypothetical protein